MRDVAVVASAFLHEASSSRDEVELIAAVVSEALANAGPAKAEIDFVCSGSADLLIGRPFSFVQGLDGIAAWPPIQESHVEMDGAWALYEAWIRLQIGDIDAALVYCFGRPSTGDFARISVLQLDPYTMAPLAADAHVLAGLQARAMADRRGEEYVETVALPVVDGACAVVLAAGELARQACVQPAWIIGIDHRIEAHALGARDLSQSVSSELAARNAGLEKYVGAQQQHIGHVHIEASHSHVQALVMESLVNGGCNDSAQTHVGAFTPMVTGLSNIARAANDVIEARCEASLAHAASGACLQHNLVCALAARP